MESNLCRIISYAYENVPYYNHIFNEYGIDPSKILTIEDLEQIPVFTKETILEYGYTNFISQKYLDENNNLIKSHKLRIEKTSGTTNKIMAIPWNCSDYYKSSYHHWAYRMINGNINPKSKICSDAAMDSSISFNNSNSMMCLDISELTDEKIYMILKQMIEFQPEWLYMFGGLLYLLVIKAKEFQLRFPDSLRYIELKGEPVLEHYTKFIENYTGIKPADMYGCTETNGIGYKCKNGNFHLLDKNVITQIVDENKTVPIGKMGNVCVTGLYNTVMPIIRYKLNDKAAMYPSENCVCGNRSDYLKLYVTRIPKYLILDQNECFEYASLYYSFHNNLNFIKYNSNCFRLNLFLKEFNTYEVIFECSQNLKRIEEIFLSIMHAYGFNYLNFTFSYSNDSNMSFRGFLKINGDIAI